MKVIKIGAEWCPGCLIMKPRWQEIESEVPWLQTEYYDYDEHQDKVALYQVKDTLPVFIFLDKDDKEILRLTGEVSEDEIMQVIEEHKDK
jgi:thiol-disulfide isomerase/thioredoxin